MYIKTAFPIHETDNMHTKTPIHIHVRHHIYSSTGFLSETGIKVTVSVPVPLSSILLMF